MVAGTAPSPGRSLIGRLIDARQPKAPGAVRRPSRLAAFVADHLATLVLLAVGDEGLWHVPWHLGPVTGPLGAALAIGLAEFKIRGK
jgi:hypothetical protein